MRANSIQMRQDFFSKYSKIDPVIKPETKEDAFSLKKTNSQRIADLNLSQHKPYLRLSVFLCLICTALFFGLASFYVYSAMEQKVVVNDYKQMTLHVNSVTKLAVEREKSILENLESFIVSMCPDVNKWPNCSIPFTSFTHFTDSLIQIGTLRGVDFSPFINRNNAQGFEAFAYEFYSSQGYPKLGMSNFSGSDKLEKGIYGLTTNGQRYQRFNDFMTPIILLGNLPNNYPAAMLDTYSVPSEKVAIDSIIACVRNKSVGCATSTGIFHLVQDMVFRPAAVLMDAIVVLN